jgi:hypothetical protein
VTRRWRRLAKNIVSARFPKTRLTVAPYNHHLPSPSPTDVTANYFPLASRVPVQSTATSYLLGIFIVYERFKIAPEEPLSLHNVKTPLVTINVGDAINEAASRAGF